MRTDAGSALAAFMLSPAAARVRTHARLSPLFVTQPNAKRVACDPAGMAFAG